MSWSFVTVDHGHSPLVSGDQDTTSKKLIISIEVVSDEPYDGVADFPLALKRQLFSGEPCSPSPGSGL